MTMRWNPWTDLSRMQNEFNNMFSSVHSDPWYRETRSEGGWNPNVDIYEDNEKYYVVAEIAGVDPSQINLKCEDNHLTIRGQRKIEFEDKKENYLRLEGNYGTFFRTFTLPSNITSEKVTAEYKYGLLKIYIPKKTVTGMHAINVKVTE